MVKLLKLAAATAAIVGFSSLAMAQDIRTRGNTALSNNAYNAYAAMPTGRYVEPRRLVLPVQRTLPFTWEEKRHFDISNGEQG